MAPVASCAQPQATRTTTSADQHPLYLDAQSRAPYSVPSDDQGWDFHDSLAIHWASYFGQTDVVELLLQRGSPVDARDAGQSTALQAAAQGGCPAVCELLIAAGADASNRDQLGWHPLHSAMRHGNFACVEVLLAHGAEINPPGSESGSPPLRNAYAAERIHTAALLASRGAALSGISGRLGVGADDCQLGLAKVAEHIAAARVLAASADATQGAPLFACRFWLERWLGAMAAASPELSRASLSSLAVDLLGAVRGAVGHAEALPAPLPTVTVEALKALQHARRGAADPHVYLRVCQDAPKALAALRRRRWGETTVLGSNRPVSLGCEAPRAPPLLETSGMLQGIGRVALAEVTVDCADAAAVDAASRTVPLLADVAPLLRAPAGGGNRAPLTRAAELKLFAAVRCAGRWGEILRAGREAAAEAQAARAALRTLRATAEDDLAAMQARLRALPGAAAYPLFGTEGEAKALSRTLAQPTATARARDRMARLSAALRAVDDSMEIMRAAATLGLQGFPRPACNGREAVLLSPADEEPEPLWELVEDQLAAGELLEDVEQDEWFMVAEEMAQQQFEEEPPPQEELPASDAAEEEPAVGGGAVVV